ncbi:MAG: hypothetical protein AAF724_10355 [Pseudomonadota bacterium]
MRLLIELQPFNPEHTQVDPLPGLPCVKKRRQLEAIIEAQIDLLEWLVSLADRMDGDADIEDGPRAFDDLEPYLSGFRGGERQGEWDLEIDDDFERDAGDEPERDDDVELDYGEMCEENRSIWGGQGARPNTSIGGAAAPSPIMFTQNQWRATCLIAQTSHVERFLRD